MKFKDGSGRAELNRWISIFLFFILNLTALGALVEAETRPGRLALDEVVIKMQATYDRAMQLKASFNQQVVIKAGGQRQEASGEVYIKRPGMMRWEYSKPDKRLVISDGKTLWMYLPSKKQVLITEPAEMALDEISKIFLMGKGKLEDSFTIKLVDPEKDASSGNYTLELVPKTKGGSFTKLTLDVDGEGFFVRKGITYDLFDNENIMAFDKVELGLPIEDEKFKFEVPQGVEVIRKSAGPVRD